MNSFRFHRFLSIGLSGLLFLLLAACGPTSPPGTTGATPASVATLTRSIAPGRTATPVTGTTSFPTPVVTTVPVSPTQTTCPAAGTARAAILAPLALGNHQNVVYIVNESRGNTLTFGTLKRYDPRTGQKAEIVKLPGVSISAAQLSADGQWILFVSGSASASGRLQLVRLDGQGLQTLYCDPISRNFQWSTSQQLIAFESQAGSTGFVKVLHVADGTIETAFSQPLNTPYGYTLRTWLDTTRLYLTRSDTDVPPDGLAVLDLGKGLHQTVSDLVTVVDPHEPGQGQLLDFASSFDGTHVFVAHSSCSYACKGPGDITVQPALGGVEQTIYSSPAYSVVQVRAVTRLTLLFRVGNYGFPDQKSGDLTHNGMWMIHTDGTGLTRLATDNANLYSNLNLYNQYPWSNGSRDGTLYALEQQTPQTPGHPGTMSLFFGSLSGGTPISFASISDGTKLTIVGWTTMA